MGRKTTPRPERLCDFEGCINRHRVRGLCLSHHYQRLAGKPLAPLRPKRTLYTGCKAEGCTRSHYAKGYCQADYEKARDNGELVPHLSRYYLDIPDEVVRSIREEYATGTTSQRRLGAKYGIDWRTVGRIVRGETRTEVQ